MVAVVLLVGCLAQLYSVINSTLTTLFFCDGGKTVSQKVFKLQSYCTFQ
ncbi:MAG: hypothetical protein QW429_01840 [Thermoprotei archaeon]